MGSSEIRINQFELSAQKLAIANKLSSLSPGKLNAKDTGNAAAIKEFVSLYEEFSTVVKDYTIVLNSDLSRVMSAAGQMSDVDKSEGVFIQGLKSGDKFRR